MHNYYWIILCVVIGLVSCGHEAVEPVAGTISAARAKRVKQRKTKPSKTFVSQNGRVTNLVYSDTYYGNESYGVVELELELEKDPNNADLWYRLGLVWQNQMYDASNALVCFEKAIELAPDAFQPRLCVLSDYMKQNDSEKIRETFMELCACAAEEKQRIELIQQAMKLLRHGHVTTEFLEEQFGDDDSVGCLMRASLSLQKKDYTASARYVIQGYELTTNKVILQYLGYISRQLERADECDAELRERLSAIKLKSMAPHLQALYNPATKTVNITAETSVEKINHAISLATTAEEQWEILRLVSRKFRFQKPSAATELKETLNAVLATNVPPQKYMHGALLLYKSLGLTNQIVSLIEHYIDKPGTSAQELKKIFSYLRWAGHVGKGGGLNVSVQDNPLGDQMEAILARMLDRFPSNRAMLNIAAEEYARIGCIKEELDTREQALSCENIPEHTRAQIAAKLITTYIRENMLEKAQEIITEHEELAHTYHIFATACARVYCQQNDTNAAWEVLSGCVNESRFAKERLTAAAALLDYRWDDSTRMTWIVDAMMREMKRAANMVRLMNTITWQQRQAFVDTLTQAGREDAILEIVEQSFLHGSPKSGQNMMPKSINAETFKGMIDRIELAGKTSQDTYNALVQISRNLGFGKLELELRMKTIGYKSTYREMAEVLKLAARMKDTEACERLATLIEQTPEIAANINALMSLRNSMQASGHQQRFERLLDKRLETMTGIPNSYLPQLLRWGKTNAVEAVFDRVCMEHGDSIEKQKQLLNIALQLNKEDYVQRYAGNMANALTNTAAISRYGRQYLEVLSQLARTDSSYTGRRDELIEEWLKNKGLPITVRYNLSQNLPGDSSTFRDTMLALLEEKPSAQITANIQDRLLYFYRRTKDIDGLTALADTMLENPTLPGHIQRNLIKTFSSVGKPVRALELCERIIVLSTDENQKKEAMKRAMQLYIELDIPERALEYADQFAAELRPGNTQQATSLMSIYQQAGKPDKALKLCLDTMRMTSDARQLNYLASNLKSLAQKYTMDVTEACKSIAAEISEQGRTPERLAVMASLADIAGDSDAAFTYLEDAARESQHPDRQAQYYQKLTEMCREQKMPDKEIEVLEKFIAVLEPRQRPRQHEQIANRIVTLLQQQKRYDEAIIRGSEFMSSPAFAHLDTDRKDSFMRPMIEVCISANDTEKAWVMTQNIDNMSRYMEYANRLDRLDDAMPRVEKHLDSDAPIKDKIYIMRDLLDVCRRTKKNDKIEETITRLDSMLAEAVPTQLLPTIAGMYESAGQADKAITYMKQHCEEARGDQREGGVTSLARMLQKNDRADEALALLNAEPQTMSILESKGQVLQNMKDYPAAAEAYLAAFAAVPAKEAWRASNYADQLANLARMYNDEKTTGKIIDQVIAKRDGSAYSAAATIYERVGKYEDAAQCLAATIEMTENPGKKRNALERYASCSEQAKNYDDAIKAYDTLVKDEETQWQSRVNYQQRMASVYRQADKPNAAREVLRDAVRECDREIKRLGKKKNAVDVYSQKATLYKTIGDPSAARDTLQYIVDHYRGTSTANRAQKQLDRM